MARGGLLPDPLLPRPTRHRLIAQAMGFCPSSEPHRRTAQPASGTRTLAWMRKRVFEGGPRSSGCKQCFTRLGRRGRRRKSCRIGPATRGFPAAGWQIVDGADEPHRPLGCKTRSYELKSWDLRVVSVDGVKSLLTQLWSACASRHPASNGPPPFSSPSIPRRFRAGLWCPQFGATRLGRVNRRRMSCSISADP